ncbi:MAG: DUF4956 domain-containing protein [Lachnospiraceae bacterium]|nr:DUF4956 domain-containing protein [Lachnospiraceae bacterium]
MFDTIFTNPVTAPQFFIMAGAALLTGLGFAWLISFKIRANKRFFIIASLIPFVVATVITFVSGNIGAGVAIGGAFGLIRFRSAQGTSDELAAILIGTAGGIAFGNGYIAYGVLIILLLGVLFFALASLPLFDHGTLLEERLLNITIPETLEYAGAFDDIFAHYLKSCERVKVKTVGMGSMFRLSYKVRMKDPSEEKAFIDEIRTRNGNLEIMLLPFTEQQINM